MMLSPRHAELVSASYYFVMLNSIQHLKDETLKQVQGDVKVSMRP
jgi:ferritin-like protein